MTFYEVLKNKFMKARPRMSNIILMSDLMCICGLISGIRVHVTKICNWDPFKGSLVRGRGLMCERGHC